MGTKQSLGKYSMQGATNFGSPNKRVFRLISKLREQKNKSVVSRKDDTDKGHVIRYPYNGTDIRNKLKSNLKNYKEASSRMMSHKLANHSNFLPVWKTPSSLNKTEYSSPKEIYEKGYKNIWKELAKHWIFSIGSARFLNSPAKHWFPLKPRELKNGPIEVIQKKNAELGKKIDEMTKTKKLHLTYKTNSSVDSQESSTDSDPELNKKYKEFTSLMQL